MPPVHVLIVEDDPGFAYLLSLKVSSHRQSVIISTASCKDDFENAIKQETFDCVITDFNLPDCRADELIERLGRVQPDCPAIVVSGSDRQDVVVRSIRSGGVDFIHKDKAIEGDHLWDRLEAVLDNARQKKNERRRVERRIQHLTRLAECDALTGLANRRKLDEMIQGNGRTMPDRRGEICVVMLDIDHFKRVNDEFGHESGDRVLQSVADILKENTTSTDIAGRYGGEEFLVLRPHHSLANTVRWTERVREDIENQTLTNKGRAIRVTASFGIVSVRCDQFESDVINKADSALYLAKSRGRNRVCTWDMVVFDRIVNDIETGSPSKRLWSTLERAHPLLGPTQFEHLTDHSFKVSERAVLIGDTLGLDSGSVSKLRLAGLCHDLGKFYIPDKILAKPSKLSIDEEFLVGRHAEDGAEMIRLLGGDSQTSEFVRHHHTRYDEHIAHGNAEFPIESRILNVADAIVAMTTNRSYQPARSHAAAACELRRQRGKQFDPQVVDAALQTSTRLTAQLV